MRGDNVFEWLDDALVLKIFSKLPDVTKFLRAAAACRRFRGLVSQMEDIVVDFNSLALTGEQSCDVEVALLLARGAKGALKSLKLVAKRKRCFHESSVPFWIAAASQTLKKLVILDGEGLKDAGPRLKAASRCLNLMQLHLEGPETHALGAEDLPGCRGGFKVLENLHLTNVQMTDESLTELVGFCPKLEHLKLEGLGGVTQVQLQSSTLNFVTLNVFLDWVENSSEGFADISLALPALQELCVGDARNSLTVKDAPLKQLRLQNFKTNLVLDLGSKANVRDLDLQLDGWPPSFEHFQAIAWTDFMGILQHTKPHCLRDLTMPCLDNKERISPATAQGFFKHILELEKLSFPASFAAACGFGSETDEGADEQILQILEDVVFENLLTILYYVDEESPECFEMVEALAKSSTKLKRIKVFANPGTKGFGLSGSLISQILQFQHAEPRIRITIELPETLVDQDDES